MRQFEGATVWRGYPLEAGETLLWDGCPAPRCFCFYHWKRAGWGLMALCGSVFAAFAYFPGRAWVMAIFALCALWFLAGQFVWARLRWKHVFYAVTDRALWALEGRERARLERKLITGVSAEWHGAALATLSFSAGNGARMTWYAVEHPELVFEVLRVKADPPERNA